MVPVIMKFIVERGEILNHGVSGLEAMCWITHKEVAQEIGTEAKFQNDFLNQLQMTLIKAQAGVKNNVRRLNKSIIQNGANNVVHVVLFALFCFFLVYLWSKMSRK
ncbi:bet1-like protein At4g14600 isoform X2 [Cannabis sativa]|uniref:bet1-like protein At4g14600 isoform X2 n=1 Tax=Cannabis sativa TaxID=3483 RepID=UPI0011E03CD0|nr:bet1-like protein At4g14600 isoform X2 [Cannabis sativa]